MSGKAAEFAPPRMRRVQAEILSAIATWPFAQSPTSPDGETGAARQAVESQMWPITIHTELRIIHLPLKLRTRTYGSNLRLVEDASHGLRLLSDHRPNSRAERSSLRSRSPSAGIQGAPLSGDSRPTSARGRVDAGAQSESEKPCPAH